MRTARTVAKHRCRCCHVYMRERRRNDWICPDCYKAEKRAARAKAAAKQGRPLYAYRSGEWKRTKPKPTAEQVLDALAEKNAIQAWRYWLQVRAPISWRDAAAKYRMQRKVDGYRERYRSDPEFHLKQRLRLQARKDARGGRAERVRMALKRCCDDRWLRATLGYGIDELRRHIERQFTSGMSWDKFTKGEIHLDHIVPISSFDTSSDDEMRAAWALANLRPLWARDNIAKGRKRTCLL